MRDFRKFYIPKTIKDPLPGDYEVTLNRGITIYVSKKEFEKKAKKFFKNYLIVEGGIGKIKVYNLMTNKKSIISPVNYTNDLKVQEIIGSINSVSNLNLVGYIICYNNNINQNAIFSYENWIKIDDSWNAVGITGIDTFDNNDKVTEQRYVIMSNGTTFIIKASDYNKISNNWEVVDNILPNLVLTEE